MEISHAVFFRHRESEVLYGQSSHLLLKKVRTIGVGFLKKILKLHPQLILSKFKGMNEATCSNLLYLSNPTAVDRSVSSSLADARDALVNAVVDSLAAYMSTASNLQQSVLVAPNSLKLFPLYILALLKQVYII